MDLENCNIQPNRRTELNFIQKPKGTEMNSCFFDSGVCTDFVEDDTTSVKQCSITAEPSFRYSSKNDVEDEPICEFNFCEFNNASDNETSNNFLVEFVKNALESDEDGDNSLHIVISKRLRNEIFVLIGLTAEFFPSMLNVQNRLGQTALHLAVITFQPEAVNLLLKTGAAVDKCDINGNLPLHLCCIYNSFHCFYEILAGYTYNDDSLKVLCMKPNFSGMNCLHLAAFHRNYNLLICLINVVKVDPNVPETKAGYNILHIAVDIGDVKLVNYLVKKKIVDLENRTYSGLTPMQLAYMKNRSDIVLLFKSYGCDNSYLHALDNDFLADSDEEMISS